MNPNVKQRRKHEAKTGQDACATDALRARFVYFAPSLFRLLAIVSSRFASRCVILCIIKFPASSYEHMPGTDDMCAYSRAKWKQHTTKSDLLFLRECNASERERGKERGELSDVNGVPTRGARPRTMKLKPETKVIWNAAHKKSQVNINSTIKENATLYIKTFFLYSPAKLAKRLHVSFAIKIRRNTAHGYGTSSFLFPYFTIPSTSNPIYSLLNNCSQCERCRFVLFRCIIDMFMSLKIETHSIRWLMIPITLAERENVSHRHTIIIHGCALTQQQQQHRQPKQWQNCKAKHFAFAPALFAFIFYAHQLKASMEHSITTMFSLHSTYIVSDLNRSLSLALRFYFSWFCHLFVSRVLHLSWSRSHSVTLSPRVFVKLFTLFTSFACAHLFAFIALTRYLNDTINYFAQICEMK